MARLGLMATMGMVTRGGLALMIWVAMATAPAPRPTRRCQCCNGQADWGYF